MGQLQQLGEQLTEMVNLLRNHNMLNYPGAPNKQVLQPDVAQELAVFRTNKIFLRTFGIDSSVLSNKFGGEMRTS